VSIFLILTIFNSRITVERIISVTGRKYGRHEEDKETLIFTLSSEESYEETFHSFMKIADD
jgi:hypothetical protein